MNLFKRKRKYFVTVVGTNHSGGTVHTDLYYTTNEPMDSEKQIERMRNQAKESLKIDNTKGLVITNIYGPLKA